MRRIINHKTSMVFLLIYLFGCGSGNNTPRSNQNTSLAKQKPEKTMTVTSNPSKYNQKQNDSGKNVSQLQIVPQLSRGDTAPTDSEEPMIADKKDRPKTIDQDKRIVISSPSNGKTPFSDGLAAVKVGKKWGFIDANGKMIIQPQFEEANSFLEGSAKVKLNGQWVRIDKTGTITNQVE